VSPPSQQLAAGNKANPAKLAATDFRITASAAAKTRQ
jgi:hypothetical protein